MSAAQVIMYTIFGASLLGISLVKKANRPQKETGLQKGIDRPKKTIDRPKKTIDRPKKKISGFLLFYQANKSKIHCMPSLCYAWKDLKNFERKEWNAKAKTYNESL
jgi:hypothetical protein